MLQIEENSEVEQIANDGRHAKYNFPFPKRAVGKISFVSVEMFTGSWLCNLHQHPGVETINQR